MKPYHYVIIVLLLIIIGLLIFARGTPSTEPVTTQTDTSVSQTSGSAPSTTSLAPKSGGSSSSGSYYTGPKPVELPVYQSNNDMSSSSVNVFLSTPAANTSVVSPLTVSGQARGTWFFEGVFPVVITDKNYRIIARGQAHAQGTWATTDFVTFYTTVSFPRQATGSAGYIILMKDNASGLSQNDRSVQRAVTFQ